MDYRFLIKSSRRPCLPPSLLGVCRWVSSLYNVTIAALPSRFPPALDVAHYHDISAFYFGVPQYDEDEGELYDVDTDGIVDQTANLGSFLIDEVAVRRVGVRQSRTVEIVGFRDLAAMCGVLDRVCNSARSRGILGTVLSRVDPVAPTGCLLQDHVSRTGLPAAHVDVLHVPPPLLIPT